MKASQKSTKIQCQCQFLLRFPLFYRVLGRFSVVSPAPGFTTNRITKGHVEDLLQKNRPQIIIAFCFSSICDLRFVYRLSAKISKTCRKKKANKNASPMGDGLIG
jgi:hypothetical protein